VKLSYFYLRYVRNSIFCIFFLAIFVGCSGSKKVLQKNTLNYLSSVSYDNQFTGLLVVEAQKRDTLLNFNGKKYFTPASVTKIFTLFAASELLQDRLPSLKFINSNDTLYVEGMGNPTLLHSYYNDSTALKFIAGYNNVALHLNNFKDEKLGPGWSWDDYQFAYQVEKGSLPIYGNVTTISSTDSLIVHPSYFKNRVIRKDSTINRNQEQNLFYYGPIRNDTLTVPLKTSAELINYLLEQATGMQIKLIDKMPVGKKEILYGIPTDSVLVKMMHQSDNFLAEQLMIMASASLSDSLDTRIAIKHVLENQLKNLKQKPRWVDGSGLSRYNLFTPESVVQVLGKMYDSIPREKLLTYFPAGGVSGTLENWYQGNPEPYVYAKSGSLGNNYNLSGYLITKSGKTLIFSFMNNHFRRPSSEVKENMQQILEQIRDEY